MSITTPDYLPAPYVRPSHADRLRAAGAGPDPRFAPIMVAPRPSGLARRIMIRTAVIVTGAGALLAITAGAASAAEPSALCRDGSLSYSASRSGTCSGHGGVAEWRAGAPARRSAAPAPVAPAPYGSPGWDCRTMGNWVCGPGQDHAPGYYVNTYGGPVLVAPWAA